MMQENNAITLDNGKKYLLLHDLEEINGKEDAKQYIKQKKEYVI